jgi:hypothetical protein
MSSDGGTSIIAPLRRIGAWHGPDVQLKRRVYIVDATDKVPEAGSILLAVCVPFAGGHTCTLRNGPCRGRHCFYATLAVDRVENDGRGEGSIVTGFRGRLSHDLTLLAGVGGRRETDILPANLPIQGELFAGHSSLPYGWFAPPL